MTVPGKGVAPAYAERSAVLEAIHTSKHRAILRHEAHVEDCSSIGGSHLYFVVLGPGNEVAYYGGWGAHLPGFEVGVHFLAAIEPLPTPRSTKDAYACVPDRKVHARVIALLPIESAAEGTRLLEELGPRHLPKAQRIERMQAAVRQAAGALGVIERRSTPRGTGVPSDPSATTTQSNERRPTSSLVRIGEWVSLDRVSPCYPFSFAAPYRRRHERGAIRSSRARLPRSGEQREDRWCCEWLEEEVFVRRVALALRRNVVAAHQ